jgi:hypothetical protein
MGTSYVDAVITGVHLKKVFHMIGESRQIEFIFQQNQFILMALITGAHYQQSRHRTEANDVAKESSGARIRFCFG